MCFTLIPLWTHESLKDDAVNNTRYRSLCVTSLTQVVECTDIA